MHIKEVQLNWLAQHQLTHNQRSTLREQSQSPVTICHQSIQWVGYIIISSFISDKKKSTVKVSKKVLKQKCLKHSSIMQKENCLSRYPGSALKIRTVFDVSNITLLIP